MSGVSHKKFAIVGKGGVGKSTISTALSSILDIPCVMVDQQRNVLDFDPNAKILEIRFDYCMSLLDDFLNSNGLLASLENLSRVISHEFGIMLGVCEAVGRTPEGFVLDMPPNTVALQLLKYPDLFTAKVVKVLTMKNRIKELTGQEDRGMKAIRVMQDIFHKGKEIMSDCEFYLLTTPEPIAILETEKLMKFLQAEGYKIGGIIVNRLRSSIGGCRYCKMTSDKQRKTIEDLLPIAAGYEMYTIPEFIEPLENVKKVLAKEICRLDY